MSRSFYSISLSAQSTAQNYIRTRVMTSSDGSSYVDHIQYYDGLGRPFQSVQKGVQSNSVKERIAALQEYDAMGRPAESWLPASITDDYLSPAAFKTRTQGTAYGYGDSRPYRQPLYEASPLERLTAQYGAGADWHTAGRSVRMEYLVNTASGVQACKLYNTAGTSARNYAAGTLRIVKTTDEDNKVEYTFTDLQGRI